jgi:hypothetical protein
MHVSLFCLDWDKDRHESITCRRLRSTLTANPKLNVRKLSSSSIACPGGNYDCTEHIRPNARRVTSLYIGPYKAEINS